jgi:hypothetical protein
VPGGAEADAAAIAHAVVALWRDVDTALGPIIGARGVLALLNRSLHLTAAQHPWLAAVHQDMALQTDLAALESLFARQHAAAALAGGTELLLAFRRLLGTLIGPALTERLLRLAWNPGSLDPPSQEAPS